MTRAQRLMACAVLSGLAAAGCGSRLAVGRSPGDGEPPTNPTQAVPRSTRIYDLPTGAELRRFDSATGNVLLSPDGQRAYSLSGPDVIAWCR